MRRIGLTLTQILLILCSCLGSKNVYNSSNNQQFFKQDTLVKDNSNYAKDLLTKAGIMETNFPTKKIISLSEYYLDDGCIGIVQIEYSESSEQWNVEPNYNILYVADNGGQFCYVVIPSAYPEDFGIYYRDKELTIFEYYSSSVGYSEFYIYQTSSSKLFLTSKFDESQRLDTKDIDLELGLVGDKSIVPIALKGC